MKLVVYGDLNADMVIRTGGLPQLGQDAVIRDFALLPGGSAANCAVIAARLGVPVVFIGTVGDDALGAMLLNGLQASGVNVEHVRSGPVPTGVVIALIGAQGERTFLSYRGANAVLDYGAIPADVLAPGDVLHVSGYSFQDAYSRKAALALMTQAQRVGAQVSLDPSFHSVSEVADLDLFRTLTFIFPNEEEARLLADRPNPRAAAAVLRARGCQTVIVTLGANGCYIDAPGSELYVAGYSDVPVSDTIGAGDAFCGGFFAGLWRGLNLVEAARVGHVVAVHVIRQPGAQQGAPTLQQVTDWLRAHGDGDLAAQLSGVGA